MSKFTQQYKLYFRNKKFLVSFFIALVLLVASVFVSYYAGLYATEKASNSVTDIILSNIPVFDVDAIFIYGPIVFWAIICLICLFNPQKFPFILKSVALFVFVRAIFISLTHIGPFPTQAAMENGFIERFISGPGGDLFFSAHTGLPFLMALVFWQEKNIRFLCLFASLFFGVIVLLGHMHYSIDVLAAFFITYTIYHIAVRIFGQDRALFLSRAGDR